MTQPFVFVVVAAVGDLSAADAIVDVLTVPSLARGCRDVVSLGRKQSGDVRFHREGSEAHTGRRWNAAAGLAAALFPSVGADLPSRRIGDRVALAAVSGRIAAAVGREGLREFGELLDSSSAAVVVVTAPDDLNAVRDLLPDGLVVAVRSGHVDVVSLGRLVQATTASLSLPGDATNGRGDQPVM